MLDKYCDEVINDNINMLVPWYIMAAYAYYVEDDPIVSDGCYDNLAKLLLKHYDEVDHQHKNLIDIDQLKAGTCLIKYPTIIKGALDDLRETTHCN